MSSVELPNVLLSVMSILVPKVIASRLYDEANKDDADIVPWTIWVPLSFKFNWESIRSPNSTWSGVAPLIKYPFKSSLDCVAFFILFIYYTY
mgnify:CR=1 FL=1